MIYLSQRDARWAELKLGASKITMGRYGCTTTCLSMLSDYFKCFIPPNKLATNPKNYTKDGLIIWKNLSFPNFKFEWREYGENRTKIDTYLKNPKTAVILQVDGFHWVVALSKTLFGDYNIADPWTGQKATLKKSYKKITGATYFKSTI